MDRIAYMDMLHPKSHYALMTTEDRLRSQLRDRALRDQLEGPRQAPRTSPERRGRLSVAILVNLFTPSRDAG